MSETETDVIEILTLQPRSHTPWALAVQSINKGTGWNGPDIMTFIERLMNKNFIVLRTEAVDRAAYPRGTAQSWWEKG